MFFSKPTVRRARSTELRPAVARLAVRVQTFSASQRAAHRTGATSVQQAGARRQSALRQPGGAEYIGSRGTKNRSNRQCSRDGGASQGGDLPGYCVSLASSPRIAQTSRWPEPFANSTALDPPVFARWTPRDHRARQWLSRANVRLTWCGCGRTAVVPFCEILASVQRGSPPRQESTPFPWPRCRSGCGVAPPRVGRRDMWRATLPISARQAMTRLKPVALTGVQLESCDVDDGW